MTEQVRTQITAVRAVAVPVRDQDRAVDFYVGTLGMEKRMDAPLPQSGGRWITVAPAHADTTLALVPTSDAAPAGTDTGIRLGTRNAAADHARLGEAGVTVDQLLRWDGVPPMFTLRDPDGNALTIVEDW
jgi:lactoylglutathione lyase